MGVIKDFILRVFKSRQDDMFDEWEEEIKQGEADEQYEWDWDSLVKERNLFKLSDELQREKYIRSLLEQVKDASGELDKLSYEYNQVTSSLKDIDELDALPQKQKEELCDAAKRILYFESEKKEFNEKKNRMSDFTFHSMERIEEYMPKAYDDIKQAEDYKILIKDDLAKLEGEKHACHYREGELKRDTDNCKGMVTICLFAVALCTIMLLVLQFGFHMQTRIGYIVVVLVGAIALTVLYLKYMEYTQELSKIQRRVNRIILLQNTVKIRYVNNTNLLDYLYVKYRVKSAKELLTQWNRYQEEKAERELDQKNEEELIIQRNSLLKLLRNYQLTDVQIWVREPIGLVNHNEMIEMRHELIVQRQKLRARMDYNKRLAKEGEKELKEFSRNYPQYAKEVIDLMNQY